MAKGDDIEERLVSFGVRIINLLRICLKELNEARVWLKTITYSEMLPASRLGDITNENDELCRIINASIKTTRAQNK